MDLSQYIGPKHYYRDCVNRLYCWRTLRLMFISMRNVPIMVIYGNGNPYDAGTSNVTVPTCGAGAYHLCCCGPRTILMGRPKHNIGYATPSDTNGCFISSVRCCHIVHESCWCLCLIARVVTSTITPAPLIKRFGCSGSVRTNKQLISVTPGGSHPTFQHVTWSPFPSIGLNTSATSVPI